MTPDPTATRSRTPTITDSMTHNPANSRSGTPMGRTATPTDRTSPMTHMTATPVERIAVPTNRTTAPAKKMGKKVTKMDRAERATNDLVEKVLKQQAEKRKKAEELHI